MSSASPPPVVAGIDGTSTSVPVLEAALNEAAARGAALEIVTAWQWQGPFELEQGHDSPQIARRRTEAMQAAVVHRVLDDDGRGVSTSCRVVEGVAGKVLVRAADGAELLVVGHERRGPVMRTVLGSVSTYCVRHAPCLILIAPVKSTDTHRGGLSTADAYRAQV